MKPDYKGFVLHMEAWDEHGINYSLGDLRQLALKYNTPIPKGYPYAKALNERRGLTEEAESLEEM